MKQVLPAWLLFCGIAMAQTTGTGTIQGVVTDATGAVIPGAKVTVRNIETGVETTRTTNSIGFYTAPALNPGRYSAACHLEGFAPSQRPNLRLEVAQTMRVDFKLSLGAVTEVVEVSAAATLLQSEKTDVGQVIEGKRIVEMPLNGRNYLQLAQFSVGVLPSRDQGKGTRHDGEQGGEGGFRAMGMHAAQNNILLDGNDNSSRNSGGPLGFQSQAVKPPVDAVGEFKVITNNTAAEYGYRTGAKVVVSTKSGTNSLHGSVYEFLRNDALDGTNFFANRSGSEKPSFRQNQYGATIGGPIVKNKMFAFFSWQGTRIRLGRSFISSVPSRAAIAGDFSEQPQPDRDIFDPLTLNASGTRMPFVGNVIPSSRIDPVAQRAAELYPAPNIAGRENLRNNFFFSPVQKNDFDQYDFRWDYNINEANRWFIRYSVRNQNEDQPGPLPFPAMGGTGQTIQLDGDNIASSLTSTFGATMFNELRFGFTHFPTRFDIPFTENLNKELGIKGAPGDTIGDGLDHGMTLFLPSGLQDLGPRGFWPNQNNLDNLLIADSFTMVKGKHTLKFGGEYRRGELFREAQRHRRGRFNFNGVYTAQRPLVAASRGATGASMADMVLGWANSATYGFAQGENHFTPYWAWFVQDDWKVTPKLTLNLGLRWELFRPPTFNNPSEQTVARLLTEINGRPFGNGERTWGADEYRQFIRFPQDGSDCGCKEDYNNFAPRVGIAYRLSNKTVLRTGAGLYYGEADNTQSEAARFFTGPPRTIELVSPQPRTTTDLFVQQGFPAIPEGAWPAGRTNINATYDLLPQFYAAQWFLDIQRELPFDTLFTIGYNGTSSSHLATGLNVNHPVNPHPTIRWQDRKRRTFFNNVTRHANMLNANYNSLTLKAEKRFSRGLTFISSFTWSHNIDYANENLEQGGGSRLYTYDLSHDRGNSSLDRRKSYVLSLIYELPFGTGQRWASSGPARWFLGDWQLGGILQILDGTWDHHTINVDTTNVGGANRGNLVRNPNLPVSERTIDRWFDTTAVVAGTPGQLDNAGRNIVEGPGRKNLDVMVAKNIPMPFEGHRMQFRFESFNFTNTPHWGRPNRSFGRPAAGTITSADEPRRIQFGLKYVF